MQQAFRAAGERAANHDEEIVILVAYHGKDNMMRSTREATLAAKIRVP